MSRLILIRHGETDWNVDGRWQGHADIPLNERGRAQAERIAQSLSGVEFAAIYSSDLARARQTAEVLSQVVRLPVQTDARLREIDQGAWQGLKLVEIEAQYAEAFHRRRQSPLTVAPPGGETVMQVRTRVLAAIQDILSAHPCQTVAVVSHGFALALILTHYRGIEIERVWELIPKNGEINTLELE
jgi:alpha-ribazole phosphatase